jgi:acetyl coenzyme A synthetase (ADP forming)-like protein
MRPIEHNANAVLRDGGSVCIRAVQPDDKGRLVELFGRLSRRSIYFRFFRIKDHLTDSELVQYTELDFVRNAALVATLREAGVERIIGVGRYMVNGPSTRRAEVAFVVADEHQGRGIGTLLLEHLVPIARRNGIDEFEADVLGENNRMLRMLSSSGFSVRRSVEGGVLRVTFPTEATGDSAEASHRRERHASAQSVRTFLNPESIAVVGASRKPRTIGAALVRNLAACNFKGRVYPVNPDAGEIHGRKAYPDVRSIGSQVDLAVIALPAHLVEQSISDCAKAGVRSVVVISSGFGEVSKEGREVEHRLKQLVRSSGMRMVGPNCMGVINTDPAVSMNATFVPAWPPPGNIGLLSQSGALGYAILERIKSLDLGLSSFVSVGNKVDVSGNDLLAYWAEDPRTNVIVLYLESFGNPRHFARVAPEVARRKPIVAMKSGRSAAGTRAASSHSAALASLDVAVDALFEQAGVIRTDTLEELIDVSCLLANQPVPPGPRVGVITNAGGPGILLADACEARGLVLPELAPETANALRQILPPPAVPSNPIDMIASAGPELYSAVIRLAGADPNIDSLIVIYIAPQLYPPEEVTSAIARAACEVPVSKPVLTVLMPARGLPPVCSESPRGRLPVFAFPENAALALSMAERYGRWRKRPRGSILTLDRFTQSAIRAVVDRVLSGATKPVWLEPADVATILRAAGLDYPAIEQASLGNAPAVADSMGYPLVVKVKSPEVIHKHDVGGVILGLRSRADVSSAVETLRKRMKALGINLENVLLQREVTGHIEALVGVTTDPTFGPLVVCGLGGVLVELLRDVSFRLTPVTDLDAQEMVSELRAARLLDGYRGAPAGDRAALSGVIQRVSALVELIPELRELDLNPVKVLEPGRGALVVDGRIRIGG